MVVYEITNYGKIEYIMYKGAPHVFPKNQTQRTDDEELAKLADEYPYIEIIKQTTPLDEMSKKELLAEAADLNLSGVTTLRKSALIEAIHAQKE